MNAAAWTLLAERSRAVVHHASLLMGVLTHPTQACDDESHAPSAARVAIEVEALIAALSAAPELAAHLRTVQRFDVTLAAWQRSVAEAGPLSQRYRTALLQQAAQVLISCLHIEGLAATEFARVDLSHRDITSRAPHPSP